MIKSEADNWTNFAGRSTCAAVTHLGERSQTVAVRITWKTTLIVGIALTAVTTYYSTMSFMDLSGSSEMLLQGNAALKIEHPQYHICSSNNPFNLTILAEMGFIDSEMVSYLMLMLSIFVVSPALLHNVKHQHQLETKFSNILYENGITNVEEIINRALFKCQDIIAGCISPGLYIDGVDCCARFFPRGSFLSTTGACVSNHGSPPFVQSIPSMSFGFVVLVNDLQDSRFLLDNAIINPVLANQKGVSFAVSDKWTDPTVALFQEKHYTRIGLWTSLALSRTTINDEEVSQSLLVKKPCASRNDPDRYRYMVPGFVNYTEYNCYYAIRQRKVNEFFKCYFVTLPYKGDLPACRPHQMLKLAVKIFVSETGYHDPVFIQRSTCVSECWKEMYSFSASYADLQLALNFKIGNTTIAPIQSNQLAALNFYYPTFTQTLLVNHYPNIPEWLGILGGNLGLFLGASMVTLIEVVVFIFSCCRSTASINSATDKIKEQEI